MAAQAQADDETIFAELQNLLIRHKYQRTCLYFTALTATAWGEFLRVNLSRVSHCQYKIIYMHNDIHCKIYTKWLSYKIRCNRKAKVAELFMHICVCLCVLCMWVCMCVGVCRCVYVCG